MFFMNPPLMNMCVWGGVWIINYMPRTGWNIDAEKISQPTAIWLPASKTASPPTPPKVSEFWLK